MQIELELGGIAVMRRRGTEDKLINKTLPDDRCASACTGSPLDGGNLGKLSSAEKIAKNQENKNLKLLCSARSESFSGVIC